jgi:hypothetical protein
MGCKNGKTAEVCSKASQPLPNLRQSARVLQGFRSLPYLLQENGAPGFNPGCQKIKLVKEEAPDGFNSAPAAGRKAGGTILLRKVSFAGL